MSPVHLPFSTPLSAKANGAAEKTQQRAHLRFVEDGTGRKRRGREEQRDREPDSGGDTHHDRRRIRQPGRPSQTGKLADRRGGDDADRLADDQADGDRRGHCADTRQRHAGVDESKRQQNGLHRKSPPHFELLHRRQANRRPRAETLQVGTVVRHEGHDRHERKRGMKAAEHGVRARTQVPAPPRTARSSSRQDRASPRRPPSQGPDRRRDALTLTAPCG